MSLATIASGLYAERPAGVLYHYTSLGGVLGIVGDRAIRATDARFFSDTAELQHAADSLLHEIGRRQSASPSAVLQQLSDWLSHRLTDGNILFIACFTTRGNLLSQWRSYCPPGRGVSLGFDAGKLCEQAFTSGFQVGRCVYEPAAQASIVAAVLDEIQRLAKVRGENTDRSTRHLSQSFHGVFEEVETDLLRVAALLKHPSFHEEDEWRFVSAAVTNYVEAPIKYREGASMLIPYLDLTLPKSVDRDLDIEHVVLGPTPSSNNSMTSLSRYLSKMRASPRQGLSACQIPYRAW